jgi:hypothetical protein
MNDQNHLPASHPEGEHSLAPATGSETALLAETFSGRIHVQWDPDAPVTPMCQLAFFIDFLKTADLFSPWVADCPLDYASNNAPKPVDVLGTLLLSVLAGHRRYAHIATLRCDRINPELLGMDKMVSVDSARRAFVGTDSRQCGSWQRTHLRRSWEALLDHPWILDVDTSVKVLYGHQEGAVLGYNPTKPGRPSHVLHTYFAANARLVLDVETRPGNETAAKHTMPGLWALIDGLPEARRPAFLRGDCAFGNEREMNEAEARAIDYLFKLRQSPGVKKLIGQLFGQEDWIAAGQGWEGTEAPLRLMGWSRPRRVVVLRRRIRGELAVNAGQARLGQTEFACVELCEGGVAYEYAVLVTSLRDSVATLAQHYRDRADMENIYDELKNQWGWGGYTTRDMHRCQVTARIVAQVYNWWTIYAGLAVPDRHAEAVTSRPLLLYAVGKQVRHAGKTVLLLTSTHAKAQAVERSLKAVADFLDYIRSTARQLNWTERWRLILDRAFARLLYRERPGNSPPLPAPT